MVLRIRTNLRKLKTKIICSSKSLMLISIEDILRGGGGGFGDGSETIPVFDDFSMCGCPDKGVVSHTANAGVNSFSYTPDYRTQEILAVTFYVEDHLGNNQIKTEKIKP